MRKIIIFYFLLVVLLFFLPLTVSKTAGAGRPIYYGKETIKWSGVPNASYYRIYYKERDSTDWQHAIDRIPNTSTALTIDYLKMWVWYSYNVVAVDNSGREYWSSGAKKFTPTTRTRTIR